MSEILNPTKFVIEPNKRVNHFSRGIDLATLSLTQAVRQP